MTNPAHLLVRFGYCLWLIATSGVASAQNANPSPSAGNVVLKSLPIKASQGVAVDATWIYAISNTKISKHDKQSGEVIVTWEADPKNKAQAHFKHLNSATVVGSNLYAAHSRFPSAPNDCTVEVFEVGGKTLKHEATIAMPSTHGSLTWIDRSADGSWWMCYAVYGQGSNAKTKLVNYRQENDAFTETREWFFPAEVVAEWGVMSCSGGSWGPDGFLYVTGHDRPEAYVLKLDEAGKLAYVRTEKGLGLFGQAIAWDRFAEKPSLWGIAKGQRVSQTLIPLK